MSESSEFPFNNPTAKEEDTSSSLLPIAEILQKINSGELKKTADFPNAIDYSEWVNHFDEIYEVGKETKVENAWVISPGINTNSFELNYLREGTHGSVSFAEAQKKFPNAVAMAHNHPFSFPPGDYARRDSDEDPALGDQFSLRDFLALVNSSHGEPPSSILAIHGGHVMIGFRTEKTPKIADLRKSGIVTQLSLALRHTLFNSSLVVSNLIQTLGENEFTENLTEKNAKRLNKTIANQWGIALYEINNFNSYESQKSQAQRVK